MRTYSNEALAYYADRYALLGLARTGITFEEYLATPQRSEARGRYQAMRMERHGISFAQYLANPQGCEERALNAEPPLPSQQAPILRLWAEQDTGLRREPLPGVAPHWSDEQLQDHQELLARYRAEADAAEADIAHLECRNGAFVEPLHHHRHPRRAGGGFAKTSGADQ